jgi:FkbM family methyltransferase
MRLPLSLAASAARLLPTSFKRFIYRIGPLARFIRRALNRSAPSGLTRVQVAAGGLQGATLLLDLQAEKDYWLGTYEPELQQAVRDWLRPGMLVYDVGANVGYISLLLARAAGASGQVFAFEPLPANLERMAANFRLNPWAHLTCIPAAVVDRAGPVRFLAHTSGAMGKAAGSAGRHDQAYPSEIEVAGIDLDGFAYPSGELAAAAFHGPPPQLIKMDIEGGEVLALQGMARLLSEARPLILLELHGPESARSAWDTLTAAGYRLLRMQPGYPPIPSLSALDWKAYIIARPEEMGGGKRET